MSAAKSQPAIFPRILQVPAALMLTLGTVSAALTTSLVAATAWSAPLPQTQTQTPPQIPSKPQHPKSNPITQGEHSTPLDSSINGKSSGKPEGNMDHEVGEELC